MELIDSPLTVFHNLFPIFYNPGAEWSELLSLWNTTNWVDEHITTTGELSTDAGDALGRAWRRLETLVTQCVGKRHFTTWDVNNNTHTHFRWLVELAIILNRLKLCPKSHISVVTVTTLQCSVLIVRCTNLDVGSVPKPNANVWWKCAWFSHAFQRERRYLIQNNAIWHTTNDGVRAVTTDLHAAPHCALQRGGAMRVPPVTWLLLV